MAQSVLLHLAAALAFPRPLSCESKLQVLTPQLQNKTLNHTYTHFLSKPAFQKLVSVPDLLATAHASSVFTAGEPGSSAAVSVRAAGHPPGSMQGLVAGTKVGRESAMRLSK